MQKTKKETNEELKFILISYQKNLWKNLKKI